MKWHVIFLIWFLQKMNFPINYTIQVHYEEVFRLRNISQLVSWPSDSFMTIKLSTTFHTDHALFSCLSPKPAAI